MTPHCHHPQALLQQPTWRGAETEEAKHEKHRGFIPNPPPQEPSPAQRQAGTAVMAVPRSPPAPQPGHHTAASRCFTANGATAKTTPTAPNGRSLPPALPSSLRPGSLRLGLGGGCVPADVEQQQQPEAQRGGGTHGQRLPQRQQRVDGTWGGHGTLTRGEGRPNNPPPRRLSRTDHDDAEHEVADLLQQLRPEGEEQPGRRLHRTDGRQVRAGRGGEAEVPQGKHLREAHELLLLESTAQGTAPAAPPTRSLVRRGAPRDPLTIWRCASAESRSESFTAPARRKKSPRRTRSARNAAAMAGMGRGRGGAERIGTALPSAAALRARGAPGSRAAPMPAAIPVPIPAPIPARSGCSSAGAEPLLALLLPALLEHRLTAARSPVGPQEREKERGKESWPSLRAGSAARGPASAALPRWRRRDPSLLQGHTGASCRRAAQRGRNFPLLAENAIRRQSCGTGRSWLQFLCKRAKSIASSVCFPLAELQGCAPRAGRAVLGSGAAVPPRSPRLRIAAAVTHSNK